ncbi:MAG: hypothetical protein HYR67_14535 [Bacteroidetes bacterium]|nr:hypothetical protein [Bacteroidota bacterium]
MIYRGATIHGITNTTNDQQNSNDPGAGRCDWTAASERQKIVYPRGGRQSTFDI